MSEKNKGLLDKQISIKSALKLAFGSVLFTAFCAAAGMTNLQQDNIITPKDDVKTEGLTETFMDFAAEVEKVKDFGEDGYIITIEKNDEIQASMAVGNAVLGYGKVNH